MIQPTMTTAEVEELLQEHLRSPYRQGPLPEATVSRSVSHPLCGDQITLQLKLDAETGLVRQAGFESQGCLLSQAAASVVCEWVEGQPPGESTLSVLALMQQTLIAPLSARRRTCAGLAFQALRELILQRMQESANSAAAAQPDRSG